MYPRTAALLHRHEEDRCDEPPGPAGLSGPSGPSGPTGRGGRARRPGPGGAAPGCPAHADPSYASPALLYGERYLRNPAESYERMRRDHGQVAPVLLESDVPAWLVLGYREIRQVVTDVQTYGRDSRRWNRWDEVPSDWPLMPWVAHSPMIHFTEGDEHRRRSAAVSDALASVDPFELRRTASASPTR
ncbi:hypothetical protein ACFQ10_17515 [Streptomyces indonesiensis]